MIGRHQLPVSSPISRRGLARGGGGLLGWDASEYLADRLCAYFGARSVLLTDSRTYALILLFDRSAAAMIPTSLTLASAAAKGRRKIADIYGVVLQDMMNARSVESVTGGQSGFLRYPVMMEVTRSELPRLGIYRGYPLPLVDVPATRAVLEKTGPEARGNFSGARELAKRLFTLPTHHLMSQRDVREVCNWVRRSLP